MQPSWSPEPVPQPPECGITGMHYHTGLDTFVSSHSQEDAGQGCPADETILHGGVTMCSMEGCWVHTSTTGN